MKQITLFLFLLISASLFAQDTVDPVANCQDITVQLDASGTVIITANQVDNMSTDNVMIQSLMVAPDSFTCAEIGPNTVTLTVTDTSGNTDTCTAVVTVEDTMAPIANCMDISVELDTNGMATITPSQVDAGSTDNCAVSLTLSQSSFSCADAGLTIPVTLTATDPGGLTDSCVAMVTITEINDPLLAVCMDITRSLDANGNLTINALELDGGSTGAGSCETLTFSASRTTFSCDDIFNPYQNSMILTGVMGDTLPTITPKFIEVYVLEDIPDLSAYGLGSANDGQGTDGQEFSFPNVPASAGSFIYVAENATDFNNYFGFAPDYTDAVAPNIDGNDAVELFFGGSVIDVFGDISDPNGRTEDWAYTNGWAHRVSETEQDGSSFIDSNWNYSGPNGLSFPEPVPDPPPAFINANVTNPYPEGANRYQLTPLGSLTPIPITLTVSNDGGVTTSTCVANVTIEDITPPVPICVAGPVNLQLDNDGAVFINALVDIAGLPDDPASIALMDSCGASVRAEPSAFFCEDIGTPQTVSLIVTDIGGNVSSCSTTVQVFDSVPPTAVCTPITVALDINGMATITPEDIGGGSTDACGIDTTSLNISSFDCSDIGPNTVVYTVTDIHGNVSSCSTTVTVVDTIAPNVVCLDITVPLDANGNATIVATDVDGGSAAACGIASRSIDTNTFNCADLGPNNVLLTVVDNNGNSENCFAVVTVEDQTPPVAVAMDITVVLGVSGTVGISGSQLDNGSTDNCGINSFAAVPDSFSCADVGAAVPVTLNVIDNSGNVGSAVAMVTVLDTTAPVASCQDITVQLDANGVATVAPSEVDGGSSVSCGALNLSLSQTVFGCADIGTNNVILTVTNDSGAMSTCTAVITVEDTVAPNVICQDINLSLDVNGMATIVPDDIDNGSTDFCGIASRTLSQSTFGCSDIGVNNVTLTVTDLNGNSQSCVALVTISDTIAPDAICQNITVQLDASGTVTILPQDVDGGSSDVCGIASQSLSVSTFDCSNIGANNVVLTLVDASGNTSSCSAIVTVEDDTDPIAVCQNITVPLDASGNAFITALDVDGGSSDNCGINSISISNGLFNCTNIGSNSVTLIVTDTSGNSDSCIATVNVVDTEAPTVVCQNITVPLDASGNAFINPMDIDGGSTDACGISSTVISQSSFDCSNLGPNNVVLTLTDLYGNVSSCTAVVTVIDPVDPIVTCPLNQSVIIPLGSQYTVPDYFGNGLASAIDNCTDPITDITQNPTAGSLVGAGNYTVSITVTDASGNQDSCNFQLQVDTTLGINDQSEQAQIQIHPNPATNSIRITNLETKQVNTIFIYDMYGRRVLSVPIVKGALQQEIDISTLQAASYFVLIEGEGTPFVQQLIKE